MLLIDALGAVLTAIALLFLVASGALLARRLLGAAVAADSLALAIATLLATVAEAELIGLLLGKLGLLRIEVALVPPALLTLLLLRSARARGEDPAAEYRRLLRRAWARLAEHPALSLVAVHATGAEALRGLLRPPLSWDSVMYHLPLAATWLQAGRIAPVFGMRPMGFYGLQPGGGAVWLWWWLAASHSELYVNLAGFLPAALLALAAGGVARELGALRAWPLVSFVTLMAPVVLRFTATQYVDTLLGGAVVAATFFALRWLRRPHGGEALLFGAGVGVGASVKVMGLAYGLALGGMALLLARGQWRARVRQLLVAAAVALAPASFFYLQAWLAGAGPFAAGCEGMNAVRMAPAFPNALSVAALWPELLRNGNLFEVFLGTSRAPTLELGVGPQALLLVPALLLPWLLPPLAASGRRLAMLVWSQIAVQLLVWVTIPYANGPQFLANLRYLDGALALAFAGMVALAEWRGIRAGWLVGLALALLVQDLLLQHAEMPFAVRVAMAGADLVAVALAFSPRLRAALRRRAAPLAAGGALLLLLVGAPLLGRFRAGDRERAFREDTTLHSAPLRNHAGAWAWLDRHGGDGTVAVVGAPVNLFWYPAMGAHLERRALYVNANRADARNAAAYPGCDPRLELDAAAWVANLRRAGVRWVHISRFPRHPFPPELEWAAARPEIFALRYQDVGNAVLELAPEPPP